jgi:hypothetical protein
LWAFVLSCSQRPPNDLTYQSPLGSTAGSSDQAWTPFDEGLVAPIWLGDDERGGLIAPLYRGAAVALEDFVFVPPDHDCTDSRATLRLEWDSRKNQVHFQIKYKKVPVRPSVHRTEGVDFFTNRAHRSPASFDDGGFRFWTILTAPTGLTKKFYYDAVTFQFVGSEYDFPSGPPATAFPISLPVFTLFGSKLYFANDDGTMFHEYTVPYDHVTAEGGVYALAYTSFIPFDLCESNSVQPTLGQLRPWASPWQPPSLGPSWRDVLHQGPAFDTTVDENQAFPDTFGFEPYVYSGIAFIGNAVAPQGGIPNGSVVHIGSLIQQVAPPLRPIVGGNGVGCQSFVVEPHVTAPRFCEMAH